MNAGPRGIGVRNGNDQLEAAAVTRWQTMLRVRCAREITAPTAGRRAENCVGSDARRNFVELANVGSAHGSKGLANASVNTATEVNPGVLRSCLIANLKSCIIRILLCFH